MKISNRIEKIRPPATLAISGKAKRMGSEGKDVVSLSAGEPDFDVPEAVAEGARKAIREKRNRYTPVSGIPELRSAIAEKLARENDLHYSPEEILVSVGAKQSIYNAVMALVEEGDEVVIPSPYWVSYPPQVDLAGGKAVIVPCLPEDGYGVSADRVRGACTERTRLLILNSPNNPTGAVYPPEILARLAALAVSEDLFVISDEIYEKILYGNASHASIANVDAAMKDRTLVVNGFSKCWAMTGWRLGYCAGPKPLIEAMGKLQGHSTSNAPSLVQYAALEAMKSGGIPVEPMRKEFERRRDFVCGRIREIEGISAPVPDGAFYVFVDVTSLLPSRIDGRSVETCADLALALLEIGLVATVPGEAFGAPGHLRLSYAASMEDLEKGLDRIEEFIRKLERS